MNQNSVTPDRQGRAASAEASRIRDVYKERDGKGKSELYAWHQPEIRYQHATLDINLAAMLFAIFGPDLRYIRVLDVGCGTGGFLRRLIDWGSTPSNLFGTELLQDRLQTAKRISPPGINWQLCALEKLDCSNPFDLVVANTVFTSILNDGDREALASSMWQRVRPGGWLLIFDFRYNNPRNPNVRKMTRKDLGKLWPSMASSYRSILLAPPIARRLVPRSRVLADLVSTIFPFVRSHFIFMAQKPHDDVQLEK